MCAYAYTCTCMCEDSIIVSASAHTRGRARAHTHLQKHSRHEKGVLVSIAAKFDEIAQVEFEFGLAEILSSQHYCQLIQYVMLHVTFSPFTPSLPPPTSCVLCWVDLTLLHTYIHACIHTYIRTYIHISTYFGSTCGGRTGREKQALSKKKEGASDANTKPRIKEKNTHAPPTVGEAANALPCVCPHAWQPPPQPHTRDCASPSGTNPSQRRPGPHPFIDSVPPIANRNCAPVRHPHGQPRTDTRHALPFSFSTSSCRPPVDLVTESVSTTNPI